jgi:hypothetical protein
MNLKYHLFYLKHLLLQPQLNQMNLMNLKYLMLLRVLKHLLHLRYLSYHLNQYYLKYRMIYLNHLIQQHLLNQ